MTLPLCEYDVDAEIGGYVIIRVLARNCFGSTYLCQHAISGKRVIIKTFPVGVENDPGFSQRFQITLEQLVNFKHPNILTTGMLSMEMDQPYAVFEYLQSHRDRPPVSLQEILSVENTLPEAQVCRLSIQLCRALEFAHACKGGIVHCNLKPSNILFAQDGQPKISEFGLLNLIGPHRLKKLMSEVVDLVQPMSLTAVSDFDTATEFSFLKPHYGGNKNESIKSPISRNDALLETLEYMSPEQRKGYPVTLQSNIYSMGLIIYRMLTGHTYSETQGRMPSSYGRHESWDVIIRKTVAKNPADRYQSVGELREAIQKTGQHKSFWVYAGAATFIFIILMGMIWFILNILNPGRTYEFETYHYARNVSDFRHYIPPVRAENLITLDTPSVTGYWTVPQFKLVFAPVPPSRVVLRMNPGATPFFVTLTYPFWMTILEVTQKQFLQVTGYDPSFFRRADGEAPVGRVTWNDAVLFCDILTQSEQNEGRLPKGFVYRLPTETEWLCAYLADETPEQHIRHILKNGVAWHAGNSDKRPQLPGQYPANLWGFYDMDGNMEEWCYDIFGDFPEGQAYDYAGPKTGIRHVLRGGGYTHDSALFSPYNRNASPPDSAESHIGFRVVLAPDIETFQFRPDSSRRISP